MEENDQRQNEDKDDWLHIEEPQETWKLELAAALKFKRQKKNEDVSGQRHRVDTEDSSFEISQI